MMLLLFHILYIWSFRAVFSFLESLYEIVLQLFIKCYMSMNYIYVDKNAMSVYRSHSTHFLLL